MSRRAPLQIETRVVENPHPVDFTADFCARHPEIVALEFGIYRYQPQTIRDKRLLKKAPPEKIAARFKQFERQLKPEQDIALHSRVYVKKNRFSWSSTAIRHIPMIDFQSQVRMEDLERVAEIANDFHCHEMAVYFSGRSYHFYGFALLTQEQWVAFMGRVLLLNMPTHEPLVDCRWVGHRLLAGYSSLRWSKNSKQYMQLPEIRYARGLNSKRWCEMKPSLNMEDTKPSTKVGDLVEA
jgi:hypothetical protein